MVKGTTLRSRVARPEAPVAALLGIATDGSEDLKLCSLAIGVKYLKTTVQEHVVHGQRALLVLSIRNFERITVHLTSTLLLSPLDGSARLALTWGYFLNPGGCI